MTKIKIEETVQAVRFRGRIQILLESATTGLFFSYLLFVLFMLLCRFTGLSMGNPWTIFGMSTVIGLGIGLVLGLLEPLGKKDAARRIDSHYGLKDRIMTSLHLITSNGSGNSPIEHLQLSDAAAHIDQVDPKAVVPFRLPKDSLKATITLGFAIFCCVLLPFSSLHGAAQEEIPHETVLAIIGDLKENLAKPLEEMIRENPDDVPLKELNEKVHEMMQKLEKSESDPRESLATLTQMEKSIKETIEEFQLEAVDASLRDLAKALENSEATSPAAKAISEGNLEKGADELEKIDFEKMGIRDRNIVSGELQKASSAMERRKQEQLAKLTQKLAEEIKQGNCEGCKNTACQFAGMCRKQCMRKGVCNQLDCQLAKLGLCKSQCAGACASCPNKGQCGGSESGSGAEGESGSGEGDSKPGTEIAGDPRTGQGTDLDGSRDRKNITGMLGSGDSEFETERTTEAANETGTREYKEAYRKFEHQIESLLNSEPVPMEQRQVIRKYFESIHPSDI